MDTLGIEYAELGWDPLQLRGEVVVVEDRTPCAVSYEVDCDGAGFTARAHLRVRRSGGLDELTLRRYPTVNWTANGRPLPELHGIGDVDLSITPSTNTPPLRRLGLGVGQSAEVTAAWVRLPALDVVPLRQVYRRVEASIYSYEAPELQFRATLEVDREGVVQSYGDLWRLVIDPPEGG